MLHPRNALENWSGAEPEDTSQRIVRTWNGTEVPEDALWDDRDTEPHFYDAREWLEYARDEIWIPKSIYNHLFNAVMEGKFRSCR